MKRVALWLDGVLRDRTHATACVCLCVATLPLLVVLWALHAHALAAPAALAAYQPARLLQAQHILTGLIAWLSLLGVVAWWGRQGPLADCSLWGLLSMGPLTLVWLGLALGYGIKDSPMGMALVQVLVFSRALFPMRQVQPWLIVGAAGIVAVEVLQVGFGLPYAPMLSEPMFLAQPLTPWWGAWTRAVFNTLVWPFAALVFFLFGSLKRYRTELENLVRVDALTGLCNRREFMERLARESHRQARHGQALSVVMLDVDHFKRINDEFGHPGGDHALAQLGTLMRRCIRQDIDVAARLGGEEFALLLPDTGGLGAQQVARKLADALKVLDVRWNGQRVPLTVSMGVAEVHDGHGDAALREADHHLYAAKRQGRDRLISAIPAPYP